MAQERHIDQSFEENRLQETIETADKQLIEAEEYSEKTREAILAAKKELREESSHSIPNLWSSDGFEALAELSQFANPVTDKIADYEEVKQKIQVLEQIKKAPYFARFDFKFEDEDAFEQIYIGRASLKKPGLHEMCVYDWRSPVASVFYRFMRGDAFYDAPGGRIEGVVDLKRQYEISEGKLDYFFDADIQIVDEFLKKLLSKNTSTKMKSVVETIQKEQDVVIRDMENDLLMVQGVAGSGKTSIALHRAAYLMYQGLSVRLSANDIMIISPNTLFEQYISEVLPELGESNVVSKVFEDIIFRLLKTRHFQTKSQFLEALFTNTQYYDIMKKALEFKLSLSFLGILDAFVCDLPKRWISFEDIYYEGQQILSREQSQKKVSGRAETPLGVKLAQLETFVLESVRQSKGGRLDKAEKAVIKEAVRKFTDLNVLELYQELFQDRSYLYTLAEKSGFTDDIDDLITFTQENLASSKLYYDDAAAAAYLHLKIYGEDKYKNMKQVVIDEAQDYYPLQYKIFSLLFPNAKYTVLGDVNQTLEKKEEISMYDLIKELLNKKKASFVTMDKSFRCTNEILQYSLKFISHSPEIKSFNRKGEEPKVYAASDQKDYEKLILEEVKTCLGQDYQSVGLVCKTEKNARCLYDSLKGKISLNLINSTSVSETNGVFVIPVYMSKGLEFDAVLICDADAENYRSEDDKNLLYIGCTRALHRLNLFCIKKGSPLLDL